MTKEEKTTYIFMIFFVIVLVKAFVFDVNSRIDYMIRDIGSPYQKFKQ